MANPAGESVDGPLRLDFDRRVKLEFHGSRITSDAGLLAYRELDDVLGLTVTGGDVLADARTGKNGRHALVGLLRQSVFGRLAGYEDVNDAERLSVDPVDAPVLPRLRRQPRESATARAGVQLGQLPAQDRAARQREALDAHDAAEQVDQDRSGTSATRSVRDVSVSRGGGVP